MLGDRHSLFSLAFHTLGRRRAQSQPLAGIMARRAWCGPMSLPHRAFGTFLGQPSSDQRRSRHPPATGILRWRLDVTHWFCRSHTLRPAVLTGWIRPTL